jgi:hypothetical protein
VIEPVAGYSKPAARSIFTLHPIHCVTTLVHIPGAMGTPKSVKAPNNTLEGYEMNRQTQLVMVTLAVLAGTAGQVEAAKEKKPLVKPPLAQAWVDVATFSGMGMPGMAGMSGEMNPMAMLGGFFGGGGKNRFGNTVSGPEGSWLDVTLYSRNTPNLEQAIQRVPAGSKLAPELKLVAPREQKAPPPSPEDEQVVKGDFEPPKGKIHLYWGCGDTIRPGQPKMLDMSKAGIEDFGKFFVSRRATQKGAHLAPGRPVWPNEQDARLVPAGASLVGEHAFKGQGVPENFKLSYPALQDIMPAIELSQRSAEGAYHLDWKALPTARAYFLAAMGSRGNSGDEMVFWTSSDVAEIGTGLVDYQTNPAVDRWLKEKVLLTPNTHSCTIPKGVFSEGAMLQMIAYGSELNLAHPPRPANPTAPWEPDWAAKIRVKSVLHAPIGMMGREEAPSGRDYSSQPARSTQDKSGSGGSVDPIDQGLNKLKGLFGF